MIPAVLVPKDPTVIGFANGLLAKPTKIETDKKEERGYEVRTLFTPGIGVGSSIRAGLGRDRRSKGDESGDDEADDRQNGQ